MQCIALTTRGDESFQVLDVILLLLILLLLDDFILLDCLGEGVVVTSVVGQLLLGQPDHVCAHTIQEILQVKARELNCKFYIIVLLQPTRHFPDKTLSRQDTFTNGIEGGSPRCARWKRSAAMIKGQRVSIQKAGCMRYVIHLSFTN